MSNDTEINMYFILKMLGLDNNLQNEHMFLAITEELIYFLWLWLHNINSIGLVRNRLK